MEEEKKQVGHHEDNNSLAQLSFVRDQQIINALNEQQEERTRFNKERAIEAEEFIRRVKQMQKSDSRHNVRAYPYDVCDEQMIFRKLENRD